MMAEKGENTEDRPMWAERGGLDFEGRAKWDAWTALKGMKPERAKLKFVQASHCSCSCPKFCLTVYRVYICSMYEPSGCSVQCWERHRYLLP